MCDKASEKKRIRDGGGTGGLMGERRRMGERERPIGGHMLQNRTKRQIEHEKGGQGRAQRQRQGTTKGRKRPCSKLETRNVSFETKFETKPQNVTM